MLLSAFLIQDLSVMSCGLSKSNHVFRPQSPSHCARAAKPVRATIRACFELLSYSKSSRRGKSKVEKRFCSYLQIFSSDLCHKISFLLVLFLKYREYVFSCARKTKQIVLKFKSDIYWDNIVTVSSLWFSWPYSRIFLLSLYFVTPAVGRVNVGLVTAHFNIVTDWEPTRIN